MATISKQTSLYSLSEEEKHFHGKHHARYVEKLGNGGLKMDVQLLYPSVFTDVLKPGTLSDFMLQDLSLHYHVIQMRYEGLQKLPCLSVFCVRMGNKPQSLDSAWNCSHWI